MGSDAMPITVAGIPVRLEFGNLPTLQRRHVDAVYAPFVDSATHDCMTVKMTTEPGPPYIDPAGHAVWQVETRQEDGRITFRSFFEQGWIDRDAGCAQLTLREQGDPENFLRVVYAWECLFRGGLLLHASGVIRGELGYVFFGPSGAGKTTVTRLSPEAIVLSDDLVILMPQAGKFWVHGVPFRGEMVEGVRTNAAAPLYGLFALTKTPDHALSDVPVAQAVAELAASVPFVMEKPQGAAVVVARCAEIEADTPVRRLHFARNERFWEILR